MIMNLLAPNTPTLDRTARPAVRKMVKTELFGRHTHNTASGNAVNIWIRGGRFLARGRVGGQAFGETLGKNKVEAESRLHKLLAELDDETYIRPSEIDKRILPKHTNPRLTFRELAHTYLEEKRSLRGKRTAQTYYSRLVPVLVFAEHADSRRQWRLARDIDRQFAIDLRKILFQYSTTPNGRKGATPKPMSPRQVFNVLDCLRGVFNWASTPSVGKLPLGWANPLTEDIVGSCPGKDPCRPVKMPLNAVTPAIAAMDKWELCHLGLLFVLPPRPGEFAGLLIADVDFYNCCLKFGTRLGGNDFTKGRQSFVVPFPLEVEPLLRALVGGRTEGPLFRIPAEFARALRSEFVSQEDVAVKFDDWLAALPRDSVYTEQDRKTEFRRFLVKHGGVSPDYLARAFKTLLKRAMGTTRGTLYDMRHAVTQAMKDSRMPHLDLRYLTSHTTSDILNEYTSIDVVGAMAQYFATIPNVLKAITERVESLGLARVASKATINVPAESKSTVIVHEQGSPDGCTGGAQGVHS